MTPQDTSRPWLGAAALSYGIASLVHFVHNAVYLDDYPNLPDSFTPVSVMAAWLVVAAVGATGYALWRRGTAWGLLLLAAFGISGYAGLLHYARAPIGDHSLAMNLTIWLESLTGTMVLLAVVWAWRRQRLDAATSA